MSLGEKNCNGHYAIVFVYPQLDQDNQDTTSIVNGDVWLNKALFLFFLNFIFASNYLPCFIYFAFFILLNYDNNISICKI